MSPFRARFALCCFLASMTLSPLCAAHEVVPPDWCVQEGREPKIVARFDMDGDQLASYAHKCGMVEHPQQKDQWDVASQSMLIYCEEQAPKQGAVPFVSGPETYLSKAHHTAYRIDQGIRGVCAVCPPPSKP
ncbi:hypothetical protein ACI2IY_05210 [Lysobacter enzymogenes]|uniref:hypothetical protein n=1 Tax=Lysobacter enzymogenes TaxID=69 RepID=UPI00384EF293